MAEPGGTPASGTRYPTMPQASREPRPQRKRGRDAPSQMVLFTVEVAGRPVLVFPEEDRGEEDRGAAEKLLVSSIGPDLLDFEEAEEGRPVWDGEEELTVREARPEEAARWEQGLAEARRDDGSGEADEESHAVFLIEVDPGTEED